MGRRIIAGLVAVGLGLGIWALWPRADEKPTPTTQSSQVADPTTTTTVAVTSMSTPGATTTTQQDSHVVQTVGEAEEILRELWFGWFEGIYNQDEERIREVVATQEFLDAALDAFTSMSLLKPPRRDDIVITQIELLRADAQCLAVWTSVDLTALIGSGALQSQVDVLRHFEGSWRMATAWVHKGDLWEQDCESVLQPLS